MNRTIDLHKSLTRSLMIIFISLATFLYLSDQEASPKYSTEIIEVGNPVSVIIYK